MKAKPLERFGVMTNPEASFLPISSVRMPGVQFIEIGEIATTSFLRNNEHLASRSRICIVGNDLPNLLHDSYPHWRAVLKDWLSRGNSIEYLTVSRSPTIRTSIKTFVDSLESTSGSFKVYSLTKRGFSNTEASEYVKQWNTFHFVLFDEPKQLWVEFFHPPGETSAYNCYFFPPEVASKAPLWKILNARFRFIVEKYGEELFVTDSSKKLRIKKTNVSRVKRHRRERSLP